MGRTYILGNSPNLNQLGFNVVNFDRFENDVNIHNWVVKLFQTEEIEKLIIEISDNPITSLQIAYHIRLSIEQLRNKVLTPILFISSQSLGQIMISSRGCNHILSTTGTNFCDFDIETVKCEVEHIESINESEYLTGFLKQVNILPDETIGRHSLANLWGAYALDKAANLTTLSDNAEFKKSLFFKFKTAFNKLNLIQTKTNDDENENEIIESIYIEARGKKILYIDDEADKGWDSVLKKLFITTNQEDFVIINERVKDYESLSEKSKNLIENVNFDLYLVDLRLNGLEEDENNNTKDFSGLKILEKIKSLNKGNQVIIFTASNKTWNLKSLLEEGADGYYLKESPEYNFKPQISTQNLVSFKQDAELCLKMSFLKDVNIKVQQILENFRNIFPEEDTIHKEIETYTSIFFELVNKTRQDHKYYNYAFLQFFLLIELFVSNEGIFQDGENAYVRIDDNEVLVQQKNGDSIYQAISFYNGKYQVGKNKINLNKNQKVKRLDTNFKVSSILIFRYGNLNSSVKKWTNLYTTRNTKAAHYTNNNGIQLNDLFELFDFVEYITNNVNINLDNIQKGLKEKSMEDAIEQLKSSPFVKNKK